MKNRKRVAQNFIAQHGIVGLKALLEDFAVGESGQTTATRLGVSRERVRQWKNTFGQVVSLYQIHPDVSRVLREVSDTPVLEPETIDLDILI